MLKMLENLCFCDGSFISIITGRLSVYDCGLILLRILSRIWLFVQINEILIRKLFFVENIVQNFGRNSMLRLGHRWDTVSKLKFGSKNAILFKTHKC